VLTHDQKSLETASSSATKMFDRIKTIQP